ncbi:MAG: hypothetical protein NZL89_07330 [Leptospiraceae bacterium]|nr:hypothetical protein [Leptospiraceae bacterium]
MKSKRNLTTTAISRPVLEKLKEFCEVHGIKMYAFIDRAVLSAIAEAEGQAKERPAAARK